jgi:hypothetical protein
MRVKIRQPFPPERECCDAALVLAAMADRIGDNGSSRQAATAGARGAQRDDLRQVVGGWPDFLRA